MQAKDIVRKAFEALFEDETLHESVISRYFHVDYKQYVDGKTLNYQAFVEHMLAVKKTICNSKITFDHLISENNSVCSVHTAEGTKTSGEKIKFKVIAYFEVQDEKIILCDELSHMVEGNESDRDIAARR